MERLGLSLPIIQAPMAGANDERMATAVIQAGGLGSLPCATLTAEMVVAAVAHIREHGDGPFNLNFFCHQPPPDHTLDQARWLTSLDGYYQEFDLQPPQGPAASARRPFDELMCEVVEQVKPPVVSFHFGLPPEALLDRVKQAGCVVLSSATTVAEARWLEAHGCDIIVAQGYEAGGHRAMFLTQEVAAQPGTFALLPQVVDAVSLPVVAAGGIADGRGIAAAFALGADAVQLGTAYLSTTEATISVLHRRRLHSATDEDTVITNVFTGRPARGLSTRLVREQGPMSDTVPPFPTAAAALGPLKQAAEANQRDDFTHLWSGQGAALTPAASHAGDLTRQLADQALTCLQTLSP